MSLELANLLFPHVTDTVEDLLRRYPRRPEGQIVTRFAPSPTGFLHIGGVFTGLIAERFAHQNNNNGIVFLRIEDTDQERYLEGGIDLIINGLKNFHIQFDEGPLGDGNSDVGNFGPYIQSHRKYLYHVVAKHFIEHGFAYPCWMSPEEMDGVRKQQQDNKLIPGIYGQYSKWRDASFDDQKKMIESGTPFVIRFRSHGDLTKRVTVSDVIRGSIEMQDNFLDSILIKAKDGLPTYHFAHLVDDYLM